MGMIENVSATKWHQAVNHYKQKLCDLTKEMQKSVNTTNVFPTTIKAFLLGESAKKVVPNDHLQVIGKELAIFNAKKRNSATSVAARLKLAGSLAAGAAITLVVLYNSALFVRDKIHNVTSYLSATDTAIALRMQLKRLQESINAMAANVKDTVLNSKIFKSSLVILEESWLGRFMRTVKRCIISLVTKWYSMKENVNSIARVPTSIGANLKEFLKNKLQVAHKMHIVSVPNQHGKRVDYAMVQSVMVVGQPDQESTSAVKQILHWGPESSLTNTKLISHDVEINCNNATQRCSENNSSKSPEHASTAENTRQAVGKVSRKNNKGKAPARLNNNTACDDDTILDMAIKDKHESIKGTYRYIREGVLIEDGWQKRNGMLVRSCDVSRVIFSNLEHIWSRQIVRALRDIYPELAKSPLHMLPPEHYALSLVLEKYYFRLAEKNSGIDVNAFKALLTDECLPTDPEEADINELLSRLDWDDRVQLTGYSIGFVDNLLYRAVRNTLLWFYPPLGRFVEFIDKGMSAYNVYIAARLCYRVAKTIYYKYVEKVQLKVLPNAETHLICLPKVNDGTLSDLTLKIKRSHSYVVLGDATKKVQSKWANVLITPGDHTKIGKAIDCATVGINTADESLAVSCLHAFDSRTKNISDVDYVSTKHVSTVERDLHGQTLFLPGTSGTAFALGKVLLDSRRAKADKITSRVTLVLSTSNKISGLSGSVVVDETGKLVGVIVGSLHPQTWTGTLLDYFDIPHDRVLIIKYGPASCAFSFESATIKGLGDLNGLVAHSTGRESFLDSASKAGFHYYVTQDRTTKSKALKGSCANVYVNSEMDGNQVALVEQEEVNTTSDTMVKFNNITSIIAKPKVLLLDMKRLIDQVAERWPKAPFKKRSGGLMPGSLLLTPDNSETRPLEEGSSERRNLQVHQESGFFRACLLGIMSILEHIQSRNARIIGENVDINVIIDCTDVHLNQDNLFALVTMLKLIKPWSAAIIYSAGKAKALFSDGQTRDEVDPDAEYARKYYTHAMRRLATECRAVRPLVSTESLVVFEQHVVNHVTVLNNDDLIAVTKATENLMLEGKCDIVDYPDGKPFMVAYKALLRSIVKKLTKIVLWLPMAFEKSTKHVQKHIIRTVERISYNLIQTTRSVLSPSNWFLNNSDGELSCSALLVQPMNVLQGAFCLVVDWFLSQQYKISWKNTLCAWVADCFITYFFEGSSQDKLMLRRALYVLMGVKTLTEADRLPPLILKLIKTHTSTSWFQRRSQGWTLHAFLGSPVSALASAIIAFSDVTREIDHNAIRLSYGDWMFRNESVRMAGKRAEENVNILAKIGKGEARLLAQGFDPTGILPAINSFVQGNYSDTLKKLLSIMFKRAVAIGVSGLVLKVARDWYRQYINMEVRTSAVEAMRESFRKAIEDQKRQMKRQHAIAIVVACNLLQVLSQVEESLPAGWTRCVTAFVIPISVLELYQCGTPNASIVGAAITSLLTGRNDYSLVTLLAMFDAWLNLEGYKWMASVPVATLAAQHELGVDSFRALVLKNNQSLPVPVRVSRDQLRGLIPILRDYACSTGEVGPALPLSRVARIMHVSKDWETIKKGKLQLINFFKKNSIQNHKTAMVQEIITSEKFYKNDEPLQDTRSIYYIGNIQMPKGRDIETHTSEEEAIAPSSKNVMRKLNIKEHGGVLLSGTEIDLAIGLRQRAQGDRVCMLNWRNTASRSELIVEAVCALGDSLKRAQVKSKHLKEEEQALQYLDLKSKSTSGLITHRYTGIATIKQLEATLLNHKFPADNVLAASKFLHNVFPKIEVVKRKEPKERDEMIARHSRSSDDNRIRVIHAAEGARRLQHRHSSIWFNTTLIFARHIIPFKIGLKLSQEWASTVITDRRFTVSIDISNFDANQHRGFDLTAMLIRLYCGANSRAALKEIVLHALELSWRVNISAAGTVTVLTGTMASGDVNTSSDNSLRIGLALVIAGMMVGPKTDFQFYCQGDNAVIEGDDLQEINKVIMKLAEVGLPTKIEGVVDHCADPLRYTPEYLGCTGIKMTVNYIDFNNQSREVELVAPWRTPDRVLPKLVCANRKLSDRSIDKLTNVKILCWLITYPLDYNVIGAAALLNIDDTLFKSKQVKDYFDNKREEALDRYETEDEINKGWHHWACKSIGLIGMAKRITKTRLGWCANQGDSQQMQDLTKGKEALAAGDFFKDFNSLHHSIIHKSSSLEGCKIATNCECEDKAQLYKDIGVITNVDYKFMDNIYDNYFKCKYKPEPDNTIWNNIKSKVARFIDCETFVSHW